MPFYKWIIESSKRQNGDLGKSDLDLKKVENDANGVANRRLVNVVRQLSQLVRIADDIFLSVYDDCRALHDRTEKLRIKVKHCEETVNKLNAKTIPVPLGALSGEQLTTLPFASCHEKDVCLLSPASRPPALDRLHRSADGPSPPVFVPPDPQVGKSADGRPGSSAGSNITHIYCQPLELDSYCSSLSSAETLTEKPMSSAVEVLSTVVPIDVSGQHFSRMASFRRSLIHVDFLMRRKKKKDKRRNTVSEGETKELKEVLQKIAIENQLPTVPKSNHTSHNILVEHNHINQDFSNAKPDSSDLFLEEKNNNSISKASIKSLQNGVIHDSSNSPEQNGDNLIMKKTQNIESNSTMPFMNRKKKPRSHLPISTSSAAMTVAVKMRQTHNGVRSDDGQSSSGNWSCSSERTSSDSDQQKPNIMGNKCELQSPLSNSDDSLLTDNSTSRKMQYKNIHPSSTPERKSVPAEIQSTENSEISSYVSSECRKNSIDGDGTSTTASVDTDAIFISSGESDDELSDLSFFQETFGSSTSLSTISNGSLNSLLSRTGTEMSSSTGTLTSICQEPLPTPPPPPPKEFAVIPLSEEVTSIISPSHSLKKQKENSKLKLPKSPRKTSSKTSKNCGIDVHKTEQGTSKSLFASLVNKKPQHKNSNDKHKLKETSKIKRIPTADTPLQFDMYGNQSPRKAKQVPIFIKENVSPIIEKNKIYQLQSFCPDNSNSSTLKKETKAFLKNSKECEASSQANELKPPCSSPVLTNTDLQSYDVFSDASEKPINEELVPVPLKYGHQITVTPIRRHASIENYSNDVCRRSRVLTPSVPIRNEASSDSPSHVRSLNSRSVEVNEQHKIINKTSGYLPPNAGTKPQRPTTLMPSHVTKPTARVVLDPEGRVVYSTNSLDRRMYNVPHSGNIVTHSHKQPDSHPNHLAFAEVHRRPCKTNPDVQHSSASNSADSSYGYSTPVNSNSEQYRYNGSQGQYCINEQSYPPSPVVMEFYPSHKILPSKENSVKIVYPTVEKQSHMNNSREADLNGKYNFTPIKSCKPSSPDPNISGLPQSTLSMLTQKNVNLHSQHLERLNTPPSEKSLRSSSSECSYMLSSPPPLCNIDSRSLNGDIGTSKQSSMSTEDLFAVIHNCKKRLNIKTDSDHSLASSSRSSSPSCARQSSSRGCLAETGFLSPRNSYAQCDNARDRRSWADFRSPPVSSGERKSFASDRLGPTKPTSMHDFKMLLLQTRTSSQINGQRKSAAELLKVPVSKNNTLGINTSPMSLSPRNSISFTTQNSPTSDAYLYNGHSTVPFKRGNRARASLQPRYMMYPPIFEDCSEETENCREFEDRSKSKQLKNDGNHNRSVKNNTGASSMWV